jgi:hypothetical protein
MRTSTGAICGAIREGGVAVGANLRVPVEHSIPTFDLRSWRNAAVVATGIAAIELVALVAATVALVGKPLAHHVKNAALDHALAPLQPTPRPGSLQAGRPKVPRSATQVLVLNGNGRTGAAGVAAARVSHLGYRVRGVGNATRSDYTSTVVMYSPRHRREAVRLARDLHLRNVGPLDGMDTSQLLGAEVALIIGN